MFDTRLGWAYTRILTLVPAQTGLHSRRLRRQLLRRSAAAFAGVSIVHTILGGSVCRWVHTILGGSGFELRRLLTPSTGSLPQAPAPVSCHWGREVAVASQWLHRDLEVAFQCLGSVLAVSCKCLGGVLAVSSQCLESVLEVS